MEGRGTPMMATTEAEKYKRVPYPSSLQLPRAVQRENLEDGFLIHNLLSAEECKYLLDASEEIGYTPVDHLFDQDERNNMRVLSFDVNFVAALWERMKHAITDDDALFVSPVGFGNEGIWRPTRLNECVKYGRYDKGMKFAAHVDGPWVPREDEASVYTVLIYLNDGFHGGRTIMENCKVTPRRGTALVFFHQRTHEGEEVHFGTKYVIRTELLFRRVDSAEIPESVRRAYTKSESYKKLVKLYACSQSALVAGDISVFTRDYNASTQLQIEEKKRVDGLTSDLPLPGNVMVLVLKQLDMVDLLSCMTVCKRMKAVARDNRVWKRIYNRYFDETRYKNRLSVFSDTSYRKYLVDRGAQKHWERLDEILQWREPDFYARVKSLCLALIGKSLPAAMEFGPLKIKCALFTGEGIATSEIESCFCVMPGVGEYHYRSADRPIVGANARTYDYPLQWFDIRSNLKHLSSFVQDLRGPSTGLQIVVMPANSYPLQFRQAIASYLSSSMVSFENKIDLLLDYYQGTKNTLVVGIEDQSCFVSKGGDDVLYAGHSESETFMEDPRKYAKWTRLSVNLKHCDSIVFAGNATQGDFQEHFLKEMRARGMKNVMVLNKPEEKNRSTIPCEHAVRKGTSVKYRVITQ